MYRLTLVIAPIVTALVAVTSFPARAQIIDNRWHTPAVGILGPTDACLVAPFRPMPIAICWLDATPSRSLTWRRFTHAGTRFERATRPIPESPLTITIVGTAGSCVVVASSLAVVRAIGRGRSPDVRPPQNLVGFEIPSDGTCSSLGEPKVVLSGAHPSARFVRAAQRGSDARGERAVSRLFQTHAPDDDARNRELDGARAFVVQAGSISISALVAWERRPPHDDPATDGSSTVLALRASTGSSGSRDGVLHRGELIVDGGRILALGTVDTGRRAAGGALPAPEPWRHEQQLFELSRTALGASAVLCPPVPVFFDSPRCGNED